MNVSSKSIGKYNKLCLHYNLVADSCYRNRRNMDHALSDDFFPFIVSALIIFDMQRQMGKGLSNKYDPSKGGFASSLRKAIDKSSRLFLSLECHSISTIDISKYRREISDIYNNFAGNGILDHNGKAFDVGATKIMHFLHPALFPIIDQNSAKVLRTQFDVEYTNATSPGYSSSLYVKSMEKIQTFINRHGPESLQLLERESPLTRIFDKIAFVEGADL